MSRNLAFLASLCDRNLWDRNIRASLLQARTQWPKFYGVVEWFEFQHDDRRRREIGAQRGGRCEADSRFRY